jgi:hypothetical protein
MQGNFQELCTHSLLSCRLQLAKEASEELVLIVMNIKSQKVHCE